MLRREGGGRGFMGDLHRESQGKCFIVNNRSQNRFRKKNRGVTEVYISLEYLGLVLQAISLIVITNLTLVLFEKIDYITA